MRQKWNFPQIAVFCLILLCPAWGHPTKSSFSPNLLVQVLAAPYEAVVDGQRTLVYELLFHNLDQVAWTLEGLQVHADGVALQTLSAGDLAPDLKRLNRSSSGLKGTNLAPGDSAILYLWAELEQASPTALSHTLVLTDGEETVNFDCALTEVLQAEPVILGLPFERKGRWIAMGGPANRGVGHRTTALAVDGRLWISQRFAIDWVMMGPNGKIYSNDETKNEDHYCYGAEVLAVADGQVVRVYDGLPENVPHLTERAVPITLETVGGNWIGLEVAPNRYVMYAHLIPGSITVKEGDRVRRGQVLAKVGNTGNSTAPHLHMHVSETPHWIPSNGVPYVFESYFSEGTARALSEDGEDIEIVPREDGMFQRNRDLPRELEVLLVPEVRE